MSNPLGTQVDGNHYKTLAVQPVEYIHANGIGYFEGNVIKYVTRWKSKNGIKDLEKAKHFIDLLIQLETESAGEDYRPDIGPDWDAGEARMLHIAQNGNTGEHYPNANPLAEFAGQAPEWAKVLIQPAGCRNVYALDGEGRSHTLDKTQPSRAEGVTLLLSGK